jgi:hypothetical protein
LLPSASVQWSTPVITKRIFFDMSGLSTIVRRSLPPQGTG